MSTRGRLIGALLCLAMSGATNVADTTDEAIVSAWHAPESARWIMVTTYLNHLGDAFYYWNLRLPTSYQELCGSPFARTLPCETLRNPYSPDETLAVGDFPGQVRWVSDATGLRFGIIPKEDPDYQPPDRSRVRDSLRAIRENLGFPAELGLEQRNKRDLKDFTQEEQALWFLGYHLKLEWFLEFRNECEVPENLSMFLSKRAMKIGESGRVLEGRVKPEGRRISAISSLRNPVTNEPLPNTPVGKPGYVQVSRAGSGQTELLVIGLDGSPIVRTRILHRSCKSSPSPVEPGRLP